MPRWKTTENILHLSKDGEYFDENWMNYDRIWQYAPKEIPWDGDRPIRFEDVDLWEVITEMSGPIGVYAAYMPYAEYYVVTAHWKVVAEFEGPRANERLEAFLKENNIPYPYTPNAPDPKTWQVDTKSIIY